jgi:hypothetical protein
LRFWSCPRAVPEPPGVADPSGPGVPVGRGLTRIGPVDAGGMNGTSIAPDRPSSSSSREPAVMAASVGSEASPTRRATIST